MKRKNAIPIITALLAFLLCIYTETTFANHHKTDEGLNQINLLNFRKAAKYYEDKMDAAKPDTAEWRQNAFLYAISLMRRLPDRSGDKLEAMEILDKLIIGGVNKPYSDGALLFRGKLAEQIDFHGDTPDFDVAYKFYDKLITECPKSKYRSYAVLCRAQVEVYTMNKKRVKAAIKQLMDWLRRYPDNKYAATEWFLIAHAASYPLKDYKLSLKALLQVNKMGLPNCLQADSFFWLVGNTAMKAKDIKTAAKFYNKILTLDRSKYTTIAKDMLKKIQRGGK